MFLLNHRRSAAPKMMPGIRASSVIFELASRTTKFNRVFQPES